MEGKFEQQQPGEQNLDAANADQFEKNQRPGQSVLDSSLAADNTYSQQENPESRHKGDVSNISTSDQSNNDISTSEINDQNDILQRQEHASSDVSSQSTSENQNSNKGSNDESNLTATQNDVPSSNNQESKVDAHVGQTSEGSFANKDSDSLSDTKDVGDSKIGSDSSDTTPLQEDSPPRIGQKQENELGGSDISGGKDNNTGLTSNAPASDTDAASAK